MKKLVAFALLITYALGSSYLAHANMMSISFSNEEKHSEKITCEMYEDEANNSEQKSLATCFQKCLGQYDQINDNSKIILKDFVGHIDKPVLHAFFGINQIKQSTYSLSHAPPLGSPPILHEGYIGKTTILLI